MHKIKKNGSLLNNKAHLNFLHSHQNITEKHISVAIILMPANREIKIYFKMY